MSEIYSKINYDNVEKFEIADRKERFTNYLFDYFLITIFSFITIFLMDFFNVVGKDYLIYLVHSTTTVIYYTITEYFFQGITPGKIITRTRALTEENELMDFETTLLRSFARIIPFEAFSFLGEIPSGWHDSWTNTKVIKDY